jgi:hypothetical protein
MGDDYWDKKKWLDGLGEKFRRGVTNNIPIIPTYRELEMKLTELEDQHTILGTRYEALCKILRKQGLDRVDSYYSNLQKLAEDDGEIWITNDDGSKCKVQHKMEDKE